MYKHEAQVVKAAVDAIEHDFGIIADLIRAELGDACEAMQRMQTLHHAVASYKAEEQRPTHKPHKVHTPATSVSYECVDQRTLTVVECERRTGGGSNTPYIQLTWSDGSIQRVSPDIKHEQWMLMASHLGLGTSLDNIEHILDFAKLTKTPIPCETRVAEFSNGQVFRATRICAVGDQQDA